MEINSNGSFKRYSYADLEEFRFLILSKIEIAKAELEVLFGSLGTGNPNGTDYTGSAYRQLEDGSATLDKESLHQLAARQRKFIEQLEIALIRIANKICGVCKDWSIDS